MTNILRKLDQNGISEFNAPEDKIFANHVFEVIDNYKKAQEVVKQFQKLETMLLESENLNMAAFVAFYDNCGFRWEKGEQLLLKRANPDEICYFLYWSNRQIKEKLPHWKEAIELVFKKGNRSQKIQACTTYGNHVFFEELWAEEGKDEVKVARLKKLLNKIATEIRPKIEALQS